MAAPPAISLTKLGRLVRFTNWPTLAETDFSRGIIRDLPRSSIPAGGVYDATDFLFDMPGLARKRGGTSYQSNALGANTGSTTMVDSTDFPFGTKVVALAADGHIYDATTGTSSDIGALGISTIDKPKLYIGTLVIPASDGTTAPKKLTNAAGTVAIANLGGSPPAGKLATVHLSRIVLGANTANPNRIFFSPVPNPESTWDTANAYWDFNHNLTALAVIQGVLLGFSGGATERLVGDTPPGTVGENMSLQPVGQVGCADARSIAAWGSFIVFASQEGVYLTNGAGFDSLTEKNDGTGISSYWRAQYATVAANAGFISGGVYGRNYYILTLGYGTTIVDQLICYLPRKSWGRLTNNGCVMYAQSSTGTDELYGAVCSSSAGNRIVKHSGMFTPTASNKNDANGTAVTPVLETRMLGQGVGLKAYGHAHLTYDMRDAASDNPTLAITLATGIEADSGYTAVAESPLAEVTVSTRKRFTLSKDAQAAQLKFTQTNASSKSEIYVIEAEVRPYALSEDGS